MIRFQLFGVQVQIRPIHWVGLAFIAGALNITDMQTLMYVLIFMIAAFVSILGHEFGHALVGRYFGGGQPFISMELFGGYCQNTGGRWTRGENIMMIAAGPGMTFLFGVLGYFGLLAISGSFGDAWTATELLIRSPYYAFPLTQGAPEEAVKVFFLGCWIWISVWWTILNLLPIYPLDGGQIVIHALKSLRKAHLIGVVSCIVVAFLSFWFGIGYLLPIFMVFFGVQNYRMMNAAPY